jgi:hypothetical protein
MLFILKVCKNCFERCFAKFKVSFCCELIVVYNFIVIRIRSLVL